jgi:hypothetical protein
MVEKYQDSNTTPKTKQSE